MGEFKNGALPPSDKGSVIFDPGNFSIEDTGEVTSEKIPTLEEALEAVDGEIMFNVDSLRNRLSQVLQKLTPQVIKSVTGWDLILKALSVANI